MGLVEILITVAAVLAAVTGIIVFSRKLGGVVKKIVHFLDDFNGEEERPGVPARPAMSARIAQLEECMNNSHRQMEDMNKKLEFIEKELHPNHGSSMRDKVDNIVSRLNDVEEKIIDHVSK